MEKFIDNDPGYLDWINKNQRGFVINCDRTPKANYIILHTARCYTINGRPARGKVWTGPYIKICSLDKMELDSWAYTELGVNPRPCKICIPK